ncbi:MAG: N-6 DNA methylase [Phycisphaerales bacterium]|nr:N-6 DNA methylase [Phycisphaerales bacterium]
MAKKTKSTDDAGLFMDTRQRRHPHLIIPKLLSERAAVFPFDADELTQAEVALNKWAKLGAQGALNQKETSLDDEFLRVVFGEALGYQSRSDSPGGYQREKQYTVPGAGSADGALGRFAVGREGKPLAVIECKGAATDLDHDKFNGRTPPQQLWDYLSQLPDTPWGILTNYLGVRLYHRDSPMRAYQEFYFSEFNQPSRVKEFVYLFGPDGLLGRDSLQRPRALDLVQHSLERRTEVGDDLYEYYSQQRSLLIETLIDQYKYSTDDAIHAAQRLLDRIIFIAFCQNRGLLLPKLLENTWENVHPLSFVSNPRWKNFLVTFRAIDTGHKALDLPTGYNGGLFKEDPLVDGLELQDEPWTNVFRSIGRYDFREEGDINVDVLGRIFEKSVTELEKLRVLGLFGKQPGEGSIMPKSAMRKRFGIYYTPPTFTRFIVENTLGRLIEERVEACDGFEARLAALQKLKIIDPACGSGAFLIAAYERLEEAYEILLHRLRSDGRSKEAVTFERDYPDWILRDNLFGVDLSKESVEITQLALWIRSARKGKTLADLSHNIVCGNSLVADPDVHERALKWQQVFPDVFKDEGFDCVIGNPPWERLKLQEREFFALSSPNIASAVSAAERRRLIEQVEKGNPGLWQRYNSAKAVA